MTFKRLCIAVLMLVVSGAIALMLPHPSWAADLGSGAELFEVHCVGCHPNGGNIIRRGKGLSLKALRRNQMDDLEAIATLVRNGKSPMSAYQDRLSETEIQAVSAYVRKRADENWN